MNFQQILVLLKAKFPGRRNDVLTNMAKTIALAVESEDDAKKLIDAMAEDKVDTFAKEFRSDIDREITASNQTFEKTLRDKYDFKEKTTDPNPGADPNPGDPNNIAAMIKAGIAEAMKPMTDFMAGINADKVNATRKGMLEGVLKDVPASYRDQILRDFARMNFNDDDAFNTYLEEKKTDVATFVQDLADRGLANSGRINFGQVNKDGVSAGVASYIASRTGDGDNLGGKSL